LHEATPLHTAPVVPASLLADLIALWSLMSKPVVSHCSRHSHQAAHRLPVARSRCPLAPSLRLMCRCVHATSSRSTWSASSNRTHTSHPRSAITAGHSCGGSDDKGTSASTARPTFTSDASRLSRTSAASTRKHSRKSWQTWA
jgi:hypothetical protein